MRTSLHAALPAAPSVGRHSRLRRGFTLLEVVVAMALIGLLSVAATWFWISGFDLVRNVSAETVALSEARLALDRLAREVREIKYGTTGVTPNFCIKTMTSSRLQFYRTSTTGPYTATCSTVDTPTNANQDYAVDIQLPTASRTLSLGYAGTLASPAASAAVAANAASFSIAYKQANAASAATGPADVRFVELSLMLQPSGVPLSSYTTLIQLRNCAQATPCSTD